VKKTSIVIKMHGKCVKKQFYVLKSISTKWIDYILRRNCLLKNVIEGKIEGRVKVMVRRGRRRKQLLDYLQETRLEI
jgi:hypothetical protein